MSYFRKIRTYQEAKENCFASLEKVYYGYKVRGKRSKKMLANSWDDIHRSSLGDRCWKRHRNTQYYVRRGYGN